MDTLSAGVSPLLGKTWWPLAAASVVRWITCSPRPPQVPLTVPFPHDRHKQVLILPSAISSGRTEAMRLKEVRSSAKVAIKSVPTASG